MSSKSLSSESLYSIYLHHHHYLHMISYRKFLQAIFLYYLTSLLSLRPALSPFLTLPDNRQIPKTDPPTILSKWKWIYIFVTFPNWGILLSLSSLSILFIPPSLPVPAFCISFSFQSFFPPPFSLSLSLHLPVSFSLFRSIHLFSSPLLPFSYFLHRIVSSRNIIVVMYLVCVWGGGYDYYKGDGDNNNGDGNEVVFY